MLRREELQLIVAILDTDRDLPSHVDIHFQTQSPLEDSIRRKV